MGLYGVTLSVSRVFNVFQNSIVMVLFPKLARRSPEEIAPTTAQAARIGNLITVGCALLCGIAGPSILSLFYGPQYAAGSTALRLLLLEATLSGCVYILAQSFMAFGRPGVIAVLEGTGLLCSVPLMLWLVPLYGILGAAISLLISTSVRLALVYFGYPMILKVRLPELMPNYGDVRVLFNALCQWRMGSAT
jgi:O-antigen/teichoic acid export membrane protein